LSGSRLSAALAAAALTLLVSGHGFAYCLTRTCDPTPPSQCEVQNGCILSGKALFWPNSCVSFDVQKDGSQKEQISAGTLDTVMGNAFKQWLNADCGNGTHPSIQIADYGQVDCGKPEYNKTQPNANIVVFDDDVWPHTNTIDTLALTTVFFNGDTGEIYDANIEINSFTYPFQIGEGKGGAPDLNGVLTHEVGHFLGLSHSDQSNATMFGSYMVGMDTLDQDDVDGICASLPPNRVTADAAQMDCTPRHGFSGECGKPETGCCATAIGSSSSTNQTLGLFAFGLGLCGWRGRRFRRSGSRSALRR
jgi:hypothetical protein